MKRLVKINGKFVPYRLGEGLNDGYFEVSIGGVWERLADVTTQRDGFITRIK